MAFPQHNPLKKKKKKAIQSKSVDWNRDDGLPGKNKNS